MAASTAPPSAARSDRGQRDDLHRHRFCDAAVELAQGVDLLIHESTFAHAEAEMAFQKQHSTSTMAAQTAASPAGQLAITHLSPRYAPGNPVSPDDLLRKRRQSSQHRSCEG